MGTKVPPNTLLWYMATWKENVYVEMETMHFFEKKFTQHDYFIAWTDGVTIQHFHEILNT